MERVRALARGRGTEIAANNYGLTYSREKPAVGVSRIHGELLMLRSHADAIRAMGSATGQSLQRHHGKMALRNA
jgi:hypothetical protein